ncbi:unnamed protein product [Lactuca saligna]|uniref:MULE transposase domain-containing protein n=1 Tax=Lactuca saligna TaxID=75948 RepID=A0AA35YED5_LACSI|nr:unnamed protein product [Lactuca saligna]CAI9271473.1 unnamed protein product [Lactuca saligna]
MGRDTNNNIYPIAWAVVNVENKVNWKWFLDILVDDIGGGNGSRLTIISDGHKGLLEAVKERIPEAEHRQCVRHIYANFKKKFADEHYRKLFWVAVNSTIVPQFEEDVDGIKKLYPNAYDHLIEREPKSWSKAFFVEGRICDAMENGVSKSFNNAIWDARRKPIITMLEEIRRHWTQEIKLSRKRKGNYKWKGKYNWKWSGHVPVQEPIQEPVQEYVQEPVQAPVQASIEAPVQAPKASRIGKMHVRKRKVSERITNIGLSKKVFPKGGIGCSQNKPVTLE